MHQSNLQSACLHTLIHMRCSEKAIAWSGLFIGTALIVCQTLTLSTDHWFYVVEPLPINETIEYTKQEFALFLFNAGYWRTCRRVAPEQDKNYTDFETLRNISPSCALSFFVSNDTELEALGKAVPAIMSRNRLVAIIHVCSLILTIVGTIVGFCGYANNNVKTLIAAVVYILSGFTMAVAVMQFICVVDDEMTTRLKPTLDGEDSRYEYEYGWSFFSASLCFLGMEYSAMVNLILYFRRFSSIEDKIRMVPGLEHRMVEAFVNVKQLGISPSPSRSSARRNSRRASLAYSPRGSQQMYYTDLV